MQQPIPTLTCRFGFAKPLEALNGNNQSKQDVTQQFHLCSKICILENVLGFLKVLDAVLSLMERSLDGFPGGQKKRNQVIVYI